jgi:hypothetical protein
VYIAQCKAKAKREKAKQYFKWFSTCACISTKEKQKNKPKTNSHLVRVHLLHLRGALILRARELGARRVDLALRVASQRTFVKVVNYWRLAL